MSLRNLAGPLLIALAVLSAGCWHNNQCCRPAPPPSRCCPPGTGPAIIPPAPPGTVGFLPAGYGR